MRLGDDNNNGRRGVKKNNEKKRNKNRWRKESVIPCTVVLFIVWQIIFVYFVFTQTGNLQVGTKVIRHREGQGGHNVSEGLILREIPSATKNDEIEGNENADDVLEIENLVDVDDRLVKILKDAGISELTPKLARQIPKWEDISRDLFDIEEPHIYGLETCSDFVKNIDRQQTSYLAPAGMFNSGTNIMSKLLRNNCVLPPNRNPHFQVPWGKHNPISFRGNHNNMEDIWRNISIPAESVLPVVLIKDPYSWLGSICRHRYQTNWPHRPDHCPNLMPDKMDVRQFADRDVRPNEPVPVHIRYSNEDSKNMVYTSMAHEWNEWNQQYFSDPGFPRIIVRYEDVMFHPQAVMDKVCSCIGGELKKAKFTMFLDSAKGEELTHKGGSGFLESFLRITHQSSRLAGFHQQDLQFAKSVLDNDIMQFFGYKHPSDEIIQNTPRHEE